MTHRPCLPNDVFDDCIVIASGHLNDEFMAYLLLRRAKPFYRIVEVNIETEEIVEIASHFNIQPAINGNDISANPHTDQPTGLGFGEYGFWGEA